ncbi:DUF21 domain-containing protein At4g14230-like isoform X1 [Euphorbia lathyris]|uniref:DUF21 domain-containing protein At4g14230-like isoform X1 n=1 Tax=Euphorbia lathyris TaxID=212925 RepID=UPI0033133C6A
MTHISKTFAIDINAKLDKELMSMILENGHSRVPVYYEQPTNIIGLVLRLSYVWIQKLQRKKKLKMTMICLRILQIIMPLIFWKNTASLVSFLMMIHNVC